MAKISQVPIGGANKARSVITGFPAPRQAVGAAVTGGVISLGAQINTLVKQHDAVQDGIDSIERTAERTRALEGVAQRLDPLSPTYREDLDAGLDAAVEGINSSSRLRTIAAVQQDALTTKQQLEAAKTKGVFARGDALRVQAGKTRTALENTATADIAANPDEATRIGNKLLTDINLVRDAMNPEISRVADEALQKSLVAAQANGFAAQGRLDDAMTAIKRGEDAGIFTQEEARARKKAVRTGIATFEAGVKAANAQVRENVERSLNLGIAREQDPATLRAALIAHARGGVFENAEGELTTLLARVDTYARNSVASRLFASTVLTNVDAGRGCSTDKECDSYYQQDILANPNNEDPDTFIENLGRHVLRGGSVPPSIRKDWVAAGARKDPAFLAKQGALFGIINGANSNARGLDKAPAVVVAVDAISRLHGISHEKAALLVLDSDISDDATKTVRLGEITTNIADEFENGIALDEMVERGFGTTEQIPQQAADDFQKLVEIAYLITGDWDASVETATQQFNARYTLDTSGNGGEGELRLNSAHRFIQGEINGIDTKLATEMVNQIVARKFDDSGVIVGIPSPKQVAVNGKQEVIDTSGTPEFKLFAVPNKPGLYQVRIRTNQPNVYADGGTIRMPTAEQITEIPAYSEAIAAARASVTRAAPGRTLAGTAPRGGSAEEIALRERQAGLVEGAGDTGTINRTRTLDPPSRRRAAQEANAQQAVNEPEEKIVVEKRDAMRGLSPQAGQSMSLGHRNNNPLNIRNSGIKWDGLLAKEQGAFLQFKTVRMGMRASTIIMQSYHKRDVAEGGDTSMRSIILRWAPPKENNTTEYIRTVEFISGIAPDAPFNVRDPAALTRLFLAMIEVENGYSPYDPDELIGGIIQGLEDRPVR